MIVILHYAKDDLTTACARAWMQQGPVLVVDDGSPTPYVPDCAVPVMRLEQNLSIIDANNEAMKAHPANWYLCSNNDVFPAAGCLEKLLKRLEYPDIGIVAPGSSDAGAGVLYVPEPAGNEPDVITPHVDNHAWMFARDVIEEIGYPDAEGHPHRTNWYANKLYCYRARKAGYKVVAVRSAYVEHRRAKGYDPEADAAGQAWLRARMGEQLAEVW